MPWYNTATIVFYRLYARSKEGQENENIPEKK